MKLRLVSTDDWEGLYKNDELVLQGHRIRLTDFFEYASIDLNVDWDRCFVDLFEIEERFGRYLPNSMTEETFQELKEL